MCTQNGGKLGKMHTKWVIRWKNVNKIIFLKKLNNKIGSLGYYLRTEHNFDLKLKKKMCSSQNIERLREMGGFYFEMNIIIILCYPVKNTQKCVKWVVILIKNHTQNGQISISIYAHGNTLLPLSHPIIDV